MRSPGHSKAIRKYVAADRTGIANAASIPNTEKHEALTTPGPASTVPTMVRGDWVLFHPVYSPEELKAVDVRKSFMFSQAFLTHLLTGSASKTRDYVRQGICYHGQASSQDFRHRVWLQEQATSSRLQGVVCSEVAGQRLYPRRQSLASRRSNVVTAVDRT